jgi:transposase
MPTSPTILELDMDKLADVLQRAEAALDEEDYALLKAVVESYAYVADLVGDKNTTIRRLRKMLFGASTEKTATVTGGTKDSPIPLTQDATAGSVASAADEAPATLAPHADVERPAETPARGHGRNGADAYTGAEKIEVPHASLQPGDPCPQCEDGTVYETNRPGVLVRLKGQPPVGAVVYWLQKLRCNLCGVVFTAEAPPSADGEKYDPTVGSMIAVLKYGSGMPFHREEKLQENLGIPLPASTQWDLVAAKAEVAEPAFAELIRQAADGEVVHNDDTTVKILEMMGERAKAEALSEESSNGLKESSPKKSERRGLFTSGIVATREGRKIALFFSGRQHAGENLKDVLAHRSETLAAPIQMCDALSRNLPKELKTIVAHCLAHGRRQFVDVAEDFPEECRYVLELLTAVYHNDEVARERQLSPSARRHFHQSESGPTMEKLHIWLERQFAARLVEPNSSLGGAISYLLKHWERLTLFLRVPGAPLDNNICERALKKAILHRKNALFYKTSRGAHVGDVFMSLIHTCELCGTNAFDYLTELEHHADDLSSNPPDWMPWNYRQALTRTPASPAAAR